MNGGELRQNGPEWEEVPGETKRTSGPCGLVCWVPGVHGHLVGNDRVAVLSLLVILEETLQQSGLAALGNSSQGQVVWKRVLGREAPAGPRGGHGASLLLWPGSGAPRRKARLEG